MPPAGRAETILVWMLRIVAATSITAIVPAVMPLAWMDAVHRALGMGPLPEGPVVEYLARSLSGFYAVHGILLWILVGDIHRYGPVLTVFLVTTLVGGLGLFVVDLAAGLPAFWIAGEGPFIVAFSTVSLVLLARARAGATEPTSPVAGRD